MPKKPQLCPHCGQPIKIETSIKKGLIKRDSKKGPVQSTNFSSDDSIKSFLEDKKLYIKILGEFFRFRGDIFLSQEEFKYNISANIKPARILASLDFEPIFYRDLFSYTQKKLSEIQKSKEENVFITNLSTVAKFAQQFRNEYPGYKNGQATN